MRDWMPILALCIAACGDKEAPAPADEEVEAGADGVCPEVALASAVGDDLATGTISRGRGTWAFCEGADGGRPGDDSGRGGRDHTGNEVTIEWVAPASGTYTAHTLGSRYDTMLTLLEGGCDGPPIACNDDGGPDLTSRIRFEATAGTRYVFVLDAFGPDERGQWRFSLVEGTVDWGDSGWGWETGSWGWDSGDPWDTGGGSDGSAPNVSVSWTSDGIDVDIVGGPGGYFFGMAETDPAVADPWTGEDCVYGDTLVEGGPTVLYCHYAGNTGTVLTTGGDRASLSYQTTGFSAEQEPGVTYYLLSDSSFGGSGDCWSWGHDPSYYAGPGCTEL